LNFSDKLTWYIYTEAIKKSGIFNPDLSTISAFDGVDSTTESQATDWNLPGRKVLDITEAVSQANSISDKYDLRSSGFTGVGLDSNASLFHDLMVYRYGIMSGADQAGLDSLSSDKRKS